MICKISSLFNENIDIIFDKVQEPNILLRITSPLLKFKNISPEVLPKKWKINDSFQFKLYFLCFIPVGFHNIKVIKIDKNNYEIISNETGKIAKVWNHYIYLKKIDNKKTHYTDKIEIKAGIFTLFIWLFAKFFYRYRQKKWKKLLKSQSYSG